MTRVLTVEAYYFSNGVVLGDKKGLPEDEYEERKVEWYGGSGKVELRNLMRHKEKDVFITVVEDATQKEVQFVVRKGASLEFIRRLYETYVGTPCELNAPPPSCNETVYVAMPAEKRASRKIPVTLPQGVVELDESEEDKIKGAEPTVMAKGGLHEWMNDKTIVLDHLEQRLVTLDFDVVELKLRELPDGVPPSTVERVPPSTVERVATSPGDLEERARVEELLKNETYAKAASIFVHWGEAYLIARRLKVINSQVIKDGF